MKTLFQSPFFNVVIYVLLVTKSKGVLPGKLLNGAAFFSIPYLNFYQRFASKTCLPKVHYCMVIRVQIFCEFANLLVLQNALKSSFRLRAAFADKVRIC
jgi:hypothetical protein